MKWIDNHVVQFSCVYFFFRISGIFLLSSLTFLLVIFVNSIIIIKLGNVSHVSVPVCVRVRASTKIFFFNCSFQETTRKIFRINQTNDYFSFCFCPPHLSFGWVVRPIGKKSKINSGIPELCCWNFVGFWEKESASFGWKFVFQHFSFLFTSKETDFERPVVTVDCCVSVCVCVCWRGVKIAGNLKIINFAVASPKERKTRRFLHLVDLLCTGHRPLGHAHTHFTNTLRSCLSTLWPVLVSIFFPVWGKNIKKKTR